MKCKQILLAAIVVFALVTADARSLSYPVNAAKGILSRASITEFLNPKLSTTKKMVDETRPVSVMYTGGTIRPMIGGSASKVDAIGFHDGKVVAVGSSDKVKAAMDSLNTQYSTRNLDNGKKTLLPGLIEPHVHIVYTATFMSWEDYGPFEGQEMREDYDEDWLKEAVATTKAELEASGDLAKGYWILATGVDPSLMPFTTSNILPNGLAKLLSFNPDVVDEMEDEVPTFMLSASGHTGYVNTPVLQMMYDTYDDLQSTYPTFDEFRAHVVQNGGLQEMEEILPVLALAPVEQVTFDEENLDRLIEEANSRGVTLLYDALATESDIALLDSYFSLKPNKIRVGHAKSVQTLQDAQDLPQYTPPTTEFHNNYGGTVKLVSDGSNQGLTGYQYEPFRCEPADNVGTFNFPPFSRPDEMTPDSEFTVIVKTILDKGWPLMVHANGDKAIDLVLDAYGYALGGESGIVKRHRIEHCSLLTNDTIQRLADQGISPSFLIGHVGYWGYVFRNAIFEEKAELLDPTQSALRKGLQVTFHSDEFVTPFGPLRMMEQGITRIMEADPNRNVLNEFEKITPEQALRIVTYDAAWQCHADNWVGSLEEGKMADYVILGEDPITRADPVGMRDIPVLQTWVGGIRVY